VGIIEQSQRSLIMEAFFLRLRSIKELKVMHWVGIVNQRCRSSSSTYFPTSQAYWKKPNHLFPPAFRGFVQQPGNAD
jgi:hypothetical protein